MFLRSHTGSSWFQPFCFQAHRFPCYSHTCYTVLRPHMYTMLQPHMSPCCSHTCCTLLQPHKLHHATATCVTMLQPHVSPCYSHTYYVMLQPHVSHHVSGFVLAPAMCCA